MKKIYSKFILIQLLCLLLQFSFSKVCLFGFFSPIGLPFAFARLASGANVLIVCLTYFLSEIFLFKSFSGFAITLYQIVFLALFYFFVQIFKVKKLWLASMVFLMLSSILSLYFALGETTRLWQFFVNFSCEVAVFFYLFKFFKMYSGKFIFFKFSHTDYLLFSIMILMLSVGIFSFDFLWHYARCFVLIFPALILSKILPTDKYYMATSIMCLGAFLVRGDFSIFVLCIAVCLLLAEFKDFNKFIYAAASGVVLTIFSIIFKIYDIFSIISMVFAFFLYLVLPSKWLARVSSLFEEEASHLLLKDLQRQKVEAIKSKLMLMSSTLFNMQKDLKFLLVGKIDRRVACRELSDDVIKKCCGTCENYKMCFFGNIDKRALFENLMMKAIENGGVEQSDMQVGIEAYCKKSGIAVSEINQTAKLFLQYESKVKSEDSSKLVIASELENFAQIFSDFSKKITSEILTNERLSKILKDQLISSSVDAKEVVIAERESGIESVSMIVPSEQVARGELSKILSKFVRVKMKLESVRHIEISGLSLATFSAALKMNVNFAVASKAKEKANGDNVTLCRLSKSKYFAAICDGMGHGESANTISQMVLSLIRSMFEVGLDSTLILESINKLMLPAGLENFTTLDACIIDLELCEANFIKLGSSVSVIKHESTAEVVSCESLPIGIVQNIKPTIIKKQIFAGDIIILASDGVVDTFSGIDNFKTFVNDSKIYNLQKYVDDVLCDARESCVNHLDDMTIIGINLLKN